MNYIKALCAILFFGSLALITGCAQILTPSKQKVVITTATPSATIIYNNDSVGTGTARIKVKRTSPFQVIAVEKDGYKTGHYAFQLARLSPNYAWTILDIPLFLGPLWEIHSNRLHKYKKKHVVPELTQMEKRRPGEKFLLVNNTSVDAKRKDINVAIYRGINNYMQKTSTPYVANKHARGSSEEDLKIENAGFTTQLNASLQEMNFTDTSKGVFPNISNSMFINATIKTITFHDVAYRNRGNYPRDNHLISVEMVIDWELLDYYKQTVYVTHTNKKSDLFLLPHSGVDLKKRISDAVDDAISDNLQYALLDVHKELRDKNFLNVTSGEMKKPMYGELLLSRPQVVTGQRVNDFLKSSVSIKVDNGHGSGVVISADGYIVTNYHVVAGSKKIEVIFNNGTIVEGEVIRNNSESDLALIKVKLEGLSPLIVSEDKNPEIGIDVWAIGTPSSLDLGQTVSKGIVSGIRKTNGLTMLQIDAKISPGNSGGALINKDGTVLGIVSSKLIGYGTEGIGFAISSAEVLQSLNIRYK